MHIHIVPNRKAAPTVLLRESYREGRKVCKRTLANLSDLSPLQIQAIRASLRGEVLQPVAQTFEICSSRSHGHVQAVSLTMQRLGFASLLASKPCRERELVLAMVAQRIISPAPNWPPRACGTPTHWHLTSVCVMPPRTICMAPWTGCSQVRIGLPGRRLHPLANSRT